MSGNTNWRISESEIMLRTLTRTPTITLTKQLVYPRLITPKVIRTAASADNPQNLPKLPVPKLEDTLKKYLKSLKPLLCPVEYSNTHELLNEFECSETARVLQDHILKRARSKTNWLEEWWLNSAYLGFRSPVVIYSSPGQSIPFETFNYEDDRIVYASKLISAALSYKMLIDSKKMPIDKIGKSDLDMEQYNKVFGTCRIPCLPLDMLQFNRKSTHIIVMHKNHFFKMTVFGESKPLSERQILENLKCILAQSTEPAPPVGILTSDNRDCWAKYYKDLMCGNEATLCEIQQSLFLVCFDDKMPGCDPDYPNKQTKGGHQFIHGGGSCANSGNRWFDKTVQFIIGCDGCLGLTYEHSPSEGQPIAYMVDYLYTFIKKDIGKQIPDNCVNEVPTKLCFKVNDATNANIEQAKENIDKLVANFELECFKFEGYGKNFIKKHKLSPDSFIQMAMQYAYYKAYNCPAAHYESAATRKFVGGRTETIRSCSEESVEFAKTMLNHCKSDEQKLAALKCAIDGHKRYTLQAIEGLGVDRHLLGLKMAAKELGCDLPDIFNDIGYIRSTNFLLSTSQVATKCDAVMCYGAGSVEGYGCCYNPRDDDINFAVSCYVDGCSTGVQIFKNYLVDALCEMQEVILKGEKAATLTQKSKL